jgi:hypothetical protein
VADVESFERRERRFLTAHKRNQLVSFEQRDLNPRGGSQIVLHVLRSNQLELLLQIVRTGSVASRAYVVVRHI